MPPRAARGAQTRCASPASTAELDDAAASIATWQQVAEAHGEDVEIVDALARLHAREERWEELGGLLERAEERESRHLAGVLVDRADARRERLGQPLLAVAAYGRVLAAEPRNQAARAGLTRADQRARDARGRRRCLARRLSGRRGVGGAAGMSTCAWRHARRTRPR